MRNDLLDIRQLAGPQQLECLRVGVCVPEGTLDVYFTEGSGAEGKSDVPGTHADKEDFAAGYGCLKRAKAIRVSLVV